MSTILPVPPAADAAAPAAPAAPAAAPVVERRGPFRRLQSLAVNPLVVLGCVLIGATFGWAAPTLAAPLSIVGMVYINLLTMVVLPFMMSAVVLSLQNLYREGGTGKIVQPGSTSKVPSGGMSEATRIALGSLVGGQADNTNTVMPLLGPVVAPAVASAQEIVQQLVPSNIFAALAEGATLKALVFALLFGFAAGQVPVRISGGLQQALETVYQACWTLTRWINLPLPLILICMAAGQVGHSGIGPMVAMAGFVTGFLLVSVLVITASALVVRHRAGVGFKPVLLALREPFALGVATNNAAACMPAMVGALAGRLGFAHSRVELLVPLSVALLRAGPVVYFVSGSMFIASLYGRTLTPGELALLVAVATLTGFATAGMTGLVTVSLMGTVCAYLSLPFEAAFVLFISVDPVCAMARTALTIMADCAAVSLICARPVRL